MKCDCTVFCGDDPWIKKGKATPCAAFMKNKEQLKELKTTAQELANCRLLLGEVVTTMSHAEIFIESREKMHPTGVKLWGDLLDRTRAALQPTGAEASEQPAQCDGGKCGVGGYCDKCPRGEQPAEAVPVAATDVEYILEKLDQRILRIHGGTSDPMKHQWNLSEGDSFMHKEAAFIIRSLVHPQPAQGMVMVSRAELEDAWKQADAGNCLGLSADLRHMLDRLPK